MATNANWTIIFDDKSILKNYNEGAEIGGAVGYKINNDSFWSDSKFSNIWAIQHGTSITSDEVEYRDETPHSSFADANIGDISQFSNKWDAAHLIYLQETWDGDNVDGETEAEKITRLGARPTSYTSS
jgi:hypothetical protein|tara:strand:+ start:315 stop:698 length:384 start_codon:yes stop_codon:yes gene_type:complete